MYNECTLARVNNWYCHYSIVVLIHSRVSLVLLHPFSAHVKAVGLGWSSCWLVECCLESGQIEEGQLDAEDIKRF